MNKIISLKFKLLTVCILMSSFNYAYAQTSTSLLRDINGDGIIDLLAFGDSITRGVGDGINPGADVEERLEPPIGEAGYPLRLESWLGLNVSNKGDPGERLASAGIFRFTPTVGSSNADYVIISEGANDSFDRTTEAEMKKNVQIMINISKALGKEPVLVGIPPSSGNHSGLRPFIDAYNRAYKDLADLNQVTFADMEGAFANNCDIDEDCYLLNQPEGLHPNTKGYDAMAEVIVANFYGINLLQAGGSTLLAQALGRPESSLVIKSPVGQTAP